MQGPNDAIQFDIEQGVCNLGKTMLFYTGIDLAYGIFEILVHLFHMVTEVEHS